jgi:hypothetical protein
MFAGRAAQEESKRDRPRMPAAPDRITAAGCALVSETPSFAHRSGSPGRNLRETAETSHALARRTLGRA